jgi:DNA anti-recombination protein RmuC
MKLQKDLEEMGGRRDSVVEVPTENHEKCESEKNRLAIKIGQLESSLKEMSDSHEDELGAIREDKARALETLAAEHSAELENLKAALQSGREEVERKVSKELSDFGEKIAEKEKLAEERAGTNPIKLFTAEIYGFL